MKIEQVNDSKSTKKLKDCFSPFLFGCDLRNQEDREQKSKGAEAFDLSLVTSNSASNKQKKQLHNNIAK